MFSGEDRVFRVPLKEFVEAVVILDGSPVSSLCSPTRAPSKRDGAAVSKSILPHCTPDTPGAGNRGIPYLIAILASPLLVKET